MIRSDLVCLCVCACMYKAIKECRWKQEWNATMAPHWPHQEPGKNKARATRSPSRAKACHLSSHVPSKGRWQGVPSAGWMRTQPEAGSSNMGKAQTPRPNKPETCLNPRAGGPPHANEAQRGRLHSPMPTARPAPGKASPSPRHLYPNTTRQICHSAAAATAFQLQETARPPKHPEPLNRPIFSARLRAARPQLSTPSK